ncbi:MAG: prepilin-type N-terminal cleavage/methylation domain-containing protein, partial [Gemmatimonadota bacterium]
MHRGTTLPEIVVVLLLIGMLAGFGLPAGWLLRDRILVEREMAAVAAAYQQARLSAMVAGDPTVLWIGPDRLVVWQRVETDSVLVWQRIGPRQSGVTLESTVDRVVVAPSGLTMGVANGRITLRRGTVSR